MKTVTVSASRRYDILIERGLLRRAGELVRGVTNAGTVMLVSDDSVWPLYGEAVQKSLADAGFSVCRFVFPHGEGSKCAKTYLALLDALCENRLTRTDAVVALGGEILGKPENREEAEEMLRRLSGKTHRVTTGYALFAENFSETGSVTTEVEFEDLPEQTIKAYLDSGLWQGKAGAYGIQDGFPLVKSYEGDYDNVVGLPIAEIGRTLSLLLKQGREEK